MGVMFVITCIK